MNKATLLHVLCIVLVFLVSVSQAQDLKTILSNLEKNITPVQTAAKNFESKFEPGQHGSARYTTVAVDQKGNSTTMVYEFNLADIDPYAVREVTQKDAIYCVLVAKNKQKLIKTTKNNEVQPYDDQLSIIAKDIENARLIRENVQKAIPLAEKEVANKLKLANHDAMVNWLVANVKEVVVNNKSHAQTLTKGDKPGVLSLKQVESDGKSAQEEVSIFNLADVNVNAINYKVNGNRFGVLLETTQKVKYVGKQKNGELKAYDNSVLVLANNVDEARDLKTVFSMAVPLAVEKVKAGMPAVATEKEGLTLIKTSIAEFNLGGKKITQTFLPECVCTLTQVEQDAKASSAVVYKFNWLDLNPATNTVDVSGEKLYIDLITKDKAKVVSVAKNDKFAGYENNIRLYIPDVETSRRVKLAIDKVIEKCSANYKEPFGSDAGAVVSWLRSNITDVTVEDVTIKQVLAPVEEGKIDKLKYTYRQINSKGTGPEELVEFNFADVNPQSVSVDIKGKSLYVTFESAFKNKIFKYYKDGSIQPYTNKIEVAVPDTEKARQVVSAIKKLSKK